MKEKIVFIGDYIYPSDMASCSRVYYMAKACQAAGYDTLIIGKGKQPDGDKDISEHKGIKYTSMQSEQPKMIEKLIKFIRRRRLYYDSLKKYAADARFVIPYACSCPYHIKSILRFGREANVKIICDISEWYSFRQFQGIIGKIDYFIFQYAFMNIFDKCDGIICCSRLIRRYFEKKNKRVLVLSGLIDVEEYSPNLSINNEKRVLIYAGSPGRKDCLIQFIQAYEMLEDSIAQKIDLRIIGLPQKDISRIYRRISKKRNKGVTFLPRIPREKLIEFLKEADFSLLLRPNKRYANAGFPSKLCESLALGTPMMTNLTSDIGDYLTDKNTIIIKGTTPQSVAQAMKRAACMSNSEYSPLRERAYRIAKDNFDVNVCAQKLKAFLDEQYRR